MTCFLKPRTQNVRLVLKALVLAIAFVSLPSSTLSPSKALAAGVNAKGHRGKEKNQKKYIGPDGKWRDGGHQSGKGGQNSERSEALSRSTHYVGYKAGKAYLYLFKKKTTSKELSARKELLPPKQPGFIRRLGRDTTAMMLYASRPRRLALLAGIGFGLGAIAFPASGFYIPALTLTGTLGGFSLAEAATWNLSSKFSFLSKHNKLAIPRVWQYSRKEVEAILRK